ncbi:MAG TPA: parallel beta-helix domain-containing protein [Saprospiraceae bacterium]|nr:parallel beta-helix domain-containing protein [Saprospiraceae bacterium]
MRKILWFTGVLIVVIGSFVFLNVYEAPTYYRPFREYKDIQNELLKEFILARDSSIISLPEGHFLFSKSLILDGRKNITIRGAGMDKTVLSFKGQKEGAEGLRITNGENIILEDFTVEDATGDNIKVMDTDSIVFRRVKAAWTGKVSVKNGSYGLYPVLCNHVLIEYCEAQGSSDAGIYVGQSNHVIIRHNKAYQNVAGIESENSNHVEIYGNSAYDNTGGILVFNLPGLAQNGREIKVYDNQTSNNNRKNFGVKGAIVSNIPAGTGMLVLASQEIDIFNNEIRDNRTLGLGIISYEMVYAMEKDTREMGRDAYGTDIRFINADFRSDINYDPYPENIRTRENKFSNRFRLPAIHTDFGKIILFKNRMKIPDIAYDGITPGDQLSSKMNICIEEDNIRFVNLDAGNQFRNLSREISSFRCEF